MKYLNDIICAYQIIKSRGYDLDGIVFVTETSEETEDMFNCFGGLGIHKCTYRGPNAYRIDMDHKSMFYGSIRLYQSKGYSFGKNIFYWHDIFVNENGSDDDWEDMNDKTILLF